VTTILVRSMHILLCRPSQHACGVRAGLLPSKSARLAARSNSTRATTTSGFSGRTRDRLRTDMRALSLRGLDCPDSAGCHIYRSHLRAALGLARALKPLPSNTTVWNLSLTWAWFQLTDAQIHPECTCMQSSILTGPAIGSSTWRELNWQQCFAKRSP